MLDEIDFTEGMNYDNGFVDAGFVTDTGARGDREGGRKGGGGCDMGKSQSRSHSRFRPEKMMAPNDNSSC